MEETVCENLPGSLRHTVSIFALVHFLIWFHLISCLIANVYIFQNIQTIALTKESDYSLLCQTLHPALAGPDDQPGPPEPTEGESTV